MPSSYCVRIARLRYMIKNIEYKILSNIGIILGCVTGTMSYQDIVSLIEEIWNDELYDTSYDGIIDIRHASVDMGRSNLESFAQLILASESASEGRVAIMSSKPVETALSYLLAKRLTKGGGISVFSTWGGVTGYLGLSESVLTELAGERCTAP